MVPFLSVKEWLVITKTPNHFPTTACFFTPCGEAVPAPFTPQKLEEVPQKGPQMQFNVQPRTMATGVRNVPLFFLQQKKITFFFLFISWCEKDLFDLFFSFFQKIFFSPKVLLIWDEKKDLSCSMLFKNIFILFYAHRDVNKM